MECKNLKEVVEEYGTVAELVKEICSDRACTLDAVQKGLKTKGVDMTKAALLAVIAQIKEMMSFEKEDTYDVGDVVTYRSFYLWGLIYGGEKIGNTIVRIIYKKFYLYNGELFEDEAFREHIFSKLEFEVSERFAIDGTGGLQKALEYLKIDKEKWTNYVFVGYKCGVYCKKWDKRFECITTEHLGKLIRRTPSK